MPDEITLTPLELTEIKDDITFKVKTTETLKRVCRKLDNLNGYKDDVKSLKTHRAIHYFLIGILLTGMVGMVFKLIPILLSK